MHIFVDLTRGSSPELMDKAHGSKNHVKDTVHTVKWATGAGRKLFESSKACEKTITLACLSVIWAIRSSASVSEDEALEGISKSHMFRCSGGTDPASIGIATHTVRLIDQRVREQWVKSDMKARNLIAKLSEKLQRCDISPTVQREALCFYAVVAGPHEMSQSLVSMFEAALADIVEGNGASPDHTLIDSLPLFAVSAFLQSPGQSLRVSSTRVTHLE